VAPGYPERARLLAEVMRPAETSDGWQELAAPSSRALQGLEIVEAPDLAAEALMLALRIREALETPEKRVALVTSDRNLARRVAAELARWGVRADDSAGVPLDQSPPGSFLLLTAHCVVGDGSRCRCSPPSSTRSPRAGPRTATSAARSGRWSASCCAARGGAGWRR
jgi:ATP-dependent helicase/nuclease subunit B